MVFAQSLKPVESFVYVAAKFLTVWLVVEWLTQCLLYICRMTKLIITQLIPKKWGNQYLPLVWYKRLASYRGTVLAFNHLVLSPFESTTYLNCWNSCQTYKFLVSRHFGQDTSFLAWPHFWRTQLHSPPNGDFCPRIWAS